MGKKDKVVATTPEPQVAKKVNFMCVPYTLISYNYHVQHEEAMPSKTNQLKKRKRAGKQPNELAKKRKLTRRVRECRSVKSQNTVDF